jgi:metallo-beta-lactamase class B
MKQFFLFSALLLFSVNLTGQKNPALKIAHLTGDFYIYTTYQPIDNKPYPANGMYVVTNDGAILIDSPWDRDQLEPLLDSIRIRHKKEVVMAIATHHHADRTGCLDLLNNKGIKTYTSKLTDSFSIKKEEKRASHLFEEDTTFTFGQHSFKVLYPGKGHTADNIVVWFEKDKILYGGCFVKSIDADHLGNLQDANVAEWKFSMQKVIKQCPDPKYVIPGHESWKSIKSLQHTLQMIEDYLKQ